MPKTSKRKANRVTRDDMVIERVELPQAPIVHRSADEPNGFDVAFMNMIHAPATGIGATQ